MKNIVAGGNVAPCLARMILVDRNEHGTRGLLKLIVKGNTTNLPSTGSARSGARRPSALMKKRTFPWMICWSPPTLYAKDASSARNGSLVVHGTRLDLMVIGCGRLW